MKHARKVCKACGDEKSVRNFYRNSSNKDGRVGKCIPCYKAAVAENRELKREIYNARRRKWLEVPENRERHYGHIRRWRRTPRGKEVMAEARRTWAILNPEKHDAIVRANWRDQAQKRRQRRLESINQPQQENGTC